MRWTRIFVYTSTHKCTRMMMPQYSTRTLKQTHFSAPVHIACAPERRCSNTHLVHPTQHNYVALHQHSCGCSLWAHWHTHWHINPLLVDQSRTIYRPYTHVYHFYSTHTYHTHLIVVVCPLLALGYIQCALSISNTRCNKLYQTLLGFVCWLAVHNQPGSE